MENDVNENDSKKYWEEEAKAYNNIFDYLEKHGLEENELIYFSKLLDEYNKMSHKMSHRLLKPAIID
jgi:glutamyl/glutaminyl-tRNA synthetase